MHVWYLFTSGLLQIENKKHNKHKIEAKVTKWLQLHKEERIPIQKIIELTNIVTSADMARWRPGSHTIACSRTEESAIYWGHCPFKHIKK
jgi:hypothetical protein